MTNLSSLSIASFRGPASLTADQLSRTPLPHSRSRITAHGRGRFSCVVVVDRGTRGGARRWSMMNPRGTHESSSSSSSPPVRGTTATTRDHVDCRRRCALGARYIATLERRRRSAQSTNPIQREKRERLSRIKKKKKKKEEKESRETRFFSFSLFLAPSLSQFPGSRLNFTGSSLPPRKLQSRTEDKRTARHGWEKGEGIKEPVAQG